MAVAAFIPDGRSVLFGVGQDVAIQTVITNMLTPSPTPTLIPTIPVGQLQPICHTVRHNDPNTLFHTVCNAIAFTMHHSLNQHPFGLTLAHTAKEGALFWNVQPLKQSTNRNQGAAAWKELLCRACWMGSW
jgi:hypothetical protein|mmetsp:Transcript_60581/g.100170  ORF Transcript_60581/g.100170 Transcript_60581/m.100170 type:complete len:131 (+) Transcript_60581:1008-1400(+)